MTAFRFPTTQERVSVVGKTGSGKTHFGVWLLSHASLQEMPYVVVDFKHDDLINDIEHKREIKLKDTPDKAGLHIVHPHPWQKDEMENFFMNIWAQGNIGVFVDECYMIDKNSKAFQACLTQGRSKHIPMINLSQRPVQVSRFVFSEAEHHAVFHLNDRRDRNTIEEWLPADLDTRLPDYHSRFYNVNLDKIFHLTPAPSRESILSRFAEKLKPKPRRFF